MVHRSRSGFLIPSMCPRVGRAGTQNHLCLWFLLHSGYALVSRAVLQTHFLEGRDQLRLEELSVASSTLGRRRRLGSKVLPQPYTPPACLLGSTGTPISAWTQLPLLCEQAGLVSGSFSLLSLSLFYSSKRSWRVPSLFNETLQVHCRYCSLWAFLAIWRGQRRPPMKLRPHFDLPALLCFCWCTLSQRSEWSVQATRGASAGWGWDDIPRECSRPRCKQWSGFSAVSWKPSVLWFLVLAVQ